MRISDWSSDVCSSDLLSEDEFRALRLRNGLYMQRFAPMLRINVPYGHLNAAQLRRLGHITRKYSKGYGHFTTRQNVQLNWPQLDDVPDILVELRSEEHTSELQSLMRISYAVFCLKKKNKPHQQHHSQA